MKLAFKYAAERLGLRPKPRWGSAPDPSWGHLPPDPHFFGVAFGESATDCPPDIPLLLVAFGD